MENKEKLRENIRKNLINLRKKKGLTQGDIAAETEKTKTAVASWEQGLSLPDITILYELSKFYKVPMEYFYEEHLEVSYEWQNAEQNTIIETKKAPDHLEEKVTKIIEKYMAEHPNIVHVTAKPETVKTFHTKVPVKIINSKLNERKSRNYSKLAEEIKATEGIVAAEVRLYDPDSNIHKSINTGTSQRRLQRKRTDGETD